jgi:hypothetical protein
MSWCENAGLWQFVPTRGDVGRLRRRKLSAGEGLLWLGIQGYDLAGEGEDFIKELSARPEEELSCRGGSAPIR